MSDDVIVYVFNSFEDNAKGKEINLTELAEKLKKHPEMSDMWPGKSLALAKEEGYDWGIDDFINAIKEAK